MKERPILFSGAMVRALLNGSKTQTRRAVKSKFEIDYLPLDLDGPIWPHNSTYSDAFEEQPMLCPYGQPGGRLWVRETWRAQLGYDAYSPKNIPTLGGVEYACDGVGLFHGKLRPSIFMPRWASRITLEIVRVRVERLQAISEADAMAEGCTKNHNGYFWGGPHKAAGLKQMATATDAYRTLWESINGAGSWDLNPWCWCVEFRRITE